MFLKKEALGLDISKERVKFVYLRKEGESIRLEALGAKQIEEKEQIAGVAKTIKELLSQHRIKTKRVFTSIVSGENALVRYITLPWTPHADLYESLKYDAQDSIPFDASQIYFDFQVIDEYEKGEERLMDVLFAVAKKEVVEQHLQILKEAGLSTKCVNIDIFAVEEAYTFNEERREGTIALLNIGERITNLNIVEKGTSRFTRDIFVGAKNYTQSIAQELGISIDEARHLKESLKTKEDPYMQKLSFPLEQVHNLLVNEINRSFTYYSTQLRRESVGCMFIAGGGSKLVGLKEVFSKNLGIPVRHLNPFLRLHNATSYTMEELEEMAPLYAVSVGLALRGLA